MQRRGLIIGMAVALAAGTGVECGGRDFAPPAERPQVILVIETDIQPPQPYTVAIVIEGGNGAYPPRVPVAAGAWRHELTYASGTIMTVKLTIGEFKPRINPHTSFCRITDGSKVSEKYGTGELKERRIGCTLTTQQ